MKKMESYGKTDRGLNRSKNEDIFYVDSQKGFCFVADGMGGAAAGELASLIFERSARELLIKFPDRLKFETEELVKAVFQTANSRILRHVEEYPFHKGMGCTAELLVYNTKEIVLGHVGDSRIYQYRNGNLKQLTRDHSLVQEQLEQGLITRKEAKKHPLRSVILQAVGIHERILPDIIKIIPQVNDIFLICSDGLTEMVSDDRICEVLASGESIKNKVQVLIDMANAAGGYDNITVVLCRFR